MRSSQDNCSSLEDFSQDKEDMACPGETMRGPWEDLEGGGAVVGSSPW